MLSTQSSVPTGYYVPAPLGMSSIALIGNKIKVNNYLESIPLGASINIHAIVAMKA